MSSEYTGAWPIVDYSLLTIPYSLPRSPHPRDMPKPERQRDETDDRGHAGPVDIGLLDVADELHQQHPGDDDEGQNDDKPDHATLQSEAIAPQRYVGSAPADFSMGRRRLHPPLG